MKNANFPIHQSKVDLDELLYPALLFDHPRDVVKDSDLSLGGKRAILASWASDACAVEAAPSLRWKPATGGTISVDNILEALRALDAGAKALTIEVAGSGRTVPQHAVGRFRSRPLQSGAVVYEP